MKRFIILAITSCYHLGGMQQLAIKSVAMPKLFASSALKHHVTLPNAKFVCKQRNFCTEPEKEFIKTYVHWKSTKNYYELQELFKKQKALTKEQNMCLVDLALDAQNELEQQEEKRINFMLGCGASSGIFLSGPIMISSIEFTRFLEHTTSLWSRGFALPVFVLGLMLSYCTLVGGIVGTGSIIFGPKFNPMKILSLKRDIERFKMIQRNFQNTTDKTV